MSGSQKRGIKKIYNQRGLWDVPVVENHHGWLCAQVNICRKAQSITGSAVCKGVAPMDFLLCIATAAQNLYDFDELFRTEKWHTKKDGLEEPVDRIASISLACFGDHTLTLTHTRTYLTNSGPLSLTLPVRTSLGCLSRNYRGGKKNNGIIHSGAFSHTITLTSATATCIRCSSVF